MILVISGKENGVGAFRLLEVQAEVSLVDRLNTIYNLEVFRICSR